MVGELLFKLVAGIERQLPAIQLDAKRKAGEQALGDERQVFFFRRIGQQGDALVGGQPRLGIGEDPRPFEGDRVIRPCGENFIIQPDGTDNLTLLRKGAGLHQPDAVVPSRRRKFSNQFFQGLEAFRKLILPKLGGGHTIKRPICCGINGGKSPLRNRELSSSKQRLARRPIDRLELIDRSIGIAFGKDFQGLESGLEVIGHKQGLRLFA